MLSKKKQIYNFLLKLNKQIPKGYKLNTFTSKKRIDISKFYNFKIKQKIDYKPRGVWTSGLFNNNENSWLDWCYEEDMLEWIDPKKCTYYAIKIINDPKLILKINTKKKLEHFHKVYAVKNSFGGYSINWKQLQKEGYYGVDFSKYFVEYKSLVDYMWYSSLDASSQCIWNGKAVLDVIKL